MTTAKRDELGRLEAELERVEAEFFPLYENGQGPRFERLRVRRDEIVAAIVAIERKFDPELDHELTLAEQTRGLTDAQIRRLHERAERERREWERWRHRRSKLAPDQRGPVLKVGERECRFCGGAFRPTNASQYHCQTRCRVAAWRRDR